MPFRIGLKRHKTKYMVPWRWSCRQWATTRRWVRCILCKALCPPTFWSNAASAVQVSLADRFHSRIAERQLGRSRMRELWSKIIKARSSSLQATLLLWVRSRSKQRSHKVHWDSVSPLWLECIREYPPQITEQNHQDLPRSGRRSCWCFSETRHSQGWSKVAIGWKFVRW